MHKADSDEGRVCPSYGVSPVHLNKYIQASIGDLLFFNCLNNHLMQAQLHGSFSKMDRFLLSIFAFFCVCAI